MILVIDGIREEVAVSAVVQEDLELEDLRDRVLESIADDLKIARQLGDDEVWNSIKDFEYSAKREQDPRKLYKLAVASFSLILRTEISKKVR